MIRLSFKLTILKTITMMLSNTILYNAENASVMYLKNREYIYIAIEGYLNPETLSGFNKALVNGIMHSEVKKFLFDTGKINVIKSEDILWLSENMIPYFGKNRMSKVVFIKPENVFGSKSVDTLAGIMKIHANVKVLPNMEQAERWLFQNEVIDRNSSVITTKPSV